MRDAGYSKNEAKAIIANGFKADRDDPAMDEINENIKSIINYARGL